MGEGLFLNFYYSNSFFFYFSYILYNCCIVTSWTIQSFLRYYENCFIYYISLWSFTFFHSMKLVDASFVFLLMFLLVCYNKRRNWDPASSQNSARGTMKFGEISGINDTKLWERKRERERERDGYLQVPYVVNKKSHQHLPAAPEIHLFRIFFDANDTRFARDKSRLCSVRDRKTIPYLFGTAGGSERKEEEWGKLHIFDEDELNGCENRMLCTRKVTTVALSLCYCIIAGMKDLVTIV